MLLADPDNFGSNANVQTLWIIYSYFSGLSYASATHEYYIVQLIPYIVYIVIDIIIYSFSLVNTPGKLFFIQPQACFAVNTTKFNILA